MLTELQALIALSMTKGLGPVNTRNMIAYCGSAEQVLNMPMGKLGKIPGIGAKTLNLVKKAATSLARVEQEMRFCEKERIEILAYTEDKYPHLLKFIHDSPLILYKKGNIDLNAQHNIAIVGTRMPTDYGKKWAYQFAEYFAEKNINVVSGLAFGVDIIAHKAVLKVGGMTTGIVGHGLEQIYPSQHTERAMQMCEKGGILSEFVSGTALHPNNFPARNRIIAGLCKAILVIEAKESGGALITAHFGFEQNREVYALPGNIGQPFSAGCNKLIRENIAKLVSNPQEILDDLDIKWKDTIKTNVVSEIKWQEMDLSENEQKIAIALQEDEMHIDLLALETGIPMSELNSLLLMMEFKGILTQKSGKKFRIGGEGIG